MGLIQFRRIARPIVLAVGTLALLWPALISLREVGDRMSWFHLTGDEALHSEVVEVLAQTGSYSDWNHSLFVPSLTTGPTVIAPAAACSRVLGISGAACGRGVSLVYFLGLLGLIYCFACGGWGALVSLGVFFLHWRGLQDNLYYPYAVLGESAVAFFVALSVFSMLRGRSFLSGAAATLAVLSKPYLVFLPFALGIFGLVSLRDSRRRGLFVGIALPAIAWLLCMSAVLGVEATVQFWLKFPQIMRAANGAGLATGASWSWSFIAAQIGFKAHHIRDILSLRGVILCFFGMETLAVLAIRDSRWRPFGWFAGIHFLWWVLFSPGVQARYLMPVYLVWGLALVFWFWAQAQRYRKYLELPAMLTAMLTLVAVFGVGVPVARDWRNNWNSFERSGFARQRAAQNFWKQSPTRPPLFSTSVLPYAQDLDLVLTAPYSIRTLSDAQWNAKSAPEGWVLVGENPNALAVAAIKRWPCRQIFSVNPTEWGFWSCQSKL